MYEPVATFIQGKTESFIEGELLRVTQEMGLDVDREELLKALQYDRGQYEKGYQDGCRDSRKHGRWVHPKGHVVSNAFFCTNCNYEELSHRKINPLPGGACKADENGNFYYPPEKSYCSGCGAKMDGGNEE